MNHRQTSLPDPFKPHPLNQHHGFVDLPTSGHIAAFFTIMPRIDLQKLLKDAEAAAQTARPSRECHANSPEVVASGIEL